MAAKKNAPSVSETPPEMPTGLDTKTMLLGGIFLILLFSALHAAAAIAIPFVLALILKFVFHPWVRRAENKGIPRIAVSVLIILLLLGFIGGIGTGLSGPAADWTNKISMGYPEIKTKLGFLNRSYSKTHQLLDRADHLAGDEKQIVAVTEGSTVSDKIVSSTQIFVSSLFTTLVILLFMLSAGETFLRRFVEILPRFQDKRRAVDIAYEIERDVSHYLLTITAMNACVGVAAGLVMALSGVENPVLWGAVAFLLNYIPIIGPLTGIGIFFLVGVMVMDASWVAFLPGAAYLLIHMIEGTFLTPMLLAKRFTINPVLVVLSLIFWYWMWGIVGAIIAVPILAVLKIMCDRIDRLAAFGHLLEG